MPGSPYKSKLTPYEAEITQLRQQRPPMPYREIVIWLHQRHGVVVSINALFSFLKIRQRWNRSQSGGSATRAATAEKKLHPSRYHCHLLVPGRPALDQQPLNRVLTNRSLDLTTRPVTVTTSLD